MCTVCMCVCVSVCACACASVCQVIWDNAEPSTAVTDSQGSDCHTNLTQHTVWTFPKFFLSLCQNTVKEAQYYHSRAHATHTHKCTHGCVWLGWKMSKNIEHMRKYGADPWWLVLSQMCVCVCTRVCVCVRRNIMHHWTIPTQTAANAIRIILGQESLENTT